MAMKPNEKSPVSSASDEKVIFFRDVSLNPPRNPVALPSEYQRRSDKNDKNEKLKDRVLAADHAAEGISRKLSMEVSVLKQEKEVLSNAEKRASDEVFVLSQRVYRLQVGNMRAILDTLQSTEEAREEARAAERRKQEEHIKQLEVEWAEAKEIGRRSIILEVKSATNASEQTFIKAQKVNGSQSMRKSQVPRSWRILNKTLHELIVPPATQSFPFEI
ncbi:Uncharacterized protein Rs2_22622 [Raphanus sativus]|nr:Uncharacterized protein Rs2_22622 [Raphanus sativus]